jgi:thermitase
MKRIVIASLAAVVIGCGAITLAAPSNAVTPGNAVTPSNAAAQSSHISGQIMVSLRDKGAAAGVLRQHGLSDGPSIGSTGAQLIKVPAGKELQLIDVRPGLGFLPSGAAPEARASQESQSA